MGLTTKQIHQFYYTACVESKPISTGTILRQMLLMSLSPLRKNVFERVYDAGTGGTTAQQITKQIRSTLVSTNNALKELYDLDLITRTEKRDEHGLYYVYRVPTHR